MAKTVGVIKNEFKLFGIKLCTYTQQYKVLHTEEDTEELRDDIYLHEIIADNL